MSTEFGNKIQKAIADKNNDITTFVWKYQNGKEVKLVDCSEQELNKFYKHCHEMLFNRSLYNPGKYVVRENIFKAYDNCNAELFVRYLLHDCNIDFLKTKKDILDYINVNKQAQEINLKDYISKLFTNLPPVFEKLTFEKIMDACFDKLDVINKKMISDKFILSQGIWLTDAEKEELTEYDDNGKSKNKMDVIKVRLCLNPDIKLKISPNGLSYTEFRSLVLMPPVPKISTLTTLTLKTLRDKILLLLDNDLEYHINKWTTFQNNIEKVAASKNIEIKTC